MVVRWVAQDLYIESGSEWANASEFFLIRYSTTIAEKPGIRYFFMGAFLRLTLSITPRLSTVCMYISTGNKIQSFAFCSLH